MASMRACLLTATGRMEYRTVARPPVGPDQMLVAVSATGVCGSDVAAFHGTHPYKTAPTVLGHELCGRVVEVGADVRTFQVGDMVSSAAYVHCGSCDECRRGAINLCRRRRNLSHLGWWGSFAEYVLLEPAMAYRLPERLDPVLGALVEPLSIGLHAVDLVASKAGRSLAVLGSGGIGMCSLVAAKRLGFGPTVCVDIGARKEKLVMALGADGYLDTASDDLVEGTTRLFGDLADVVVVAAGYPGAIADAAALARVGGTLVVVSYFDGGQQVDLNALVGEELTLQFSALSTVVDFERVIEWLDESSIDPLPMITDRLPLSDAELAIRMLSEPGHAGKVILEVEA